MLCRLAAHQEKIKGIRVEMLSLPSLRLELEESQLRFIPMVFVRVLDILLKFTVDFYFSLCYMFLSILPTSRPTVELL